jgi:hypothetical protein
MAFMIREKEGGAVALSICGNKQARACFSYSCDLGKIWKVFRVTEGSDNEFQGTGTKLRFKFRLTQVEADPQLFSARDLRHADELCVVFPTSIQLSAFILSTRFE